MKLINFNVPETWLPLIDKAKGDQDRSSWIRVVVRDGLIEAGVWPKELEEEKGWFLKQKERRRHHDV